MEITRTGILLAFAACTTATDRIDVAPNELGVVALETSRTDGTYALRALDANDREIGRVSLRTGAIAGLSQVLPGEDDVGAELSLSFGELQRSYLTRETATFIVAAPREMQPLTKIVEVTAALKQDVNVTLIAASPNEDAYSVQSCPASYLLTSPVAQQCCYSYNNANIGPMTSFLRPSDGAGIERYRNPYGTGCKASDGVSSCLGANCYYGPNGFSRAYVTAKTNTYGWVFWLDDGYGDLNCNIAFYSTMQTPEYSNVTGTSPTGQGCPGGATGASQWDY